MRHFIANICANRFFTENSTFTGGQPRKVMKYTIVMETGHYCLESFGSMQNSRVHCIDNSESYGLINGAV